VTCEIVTTVKLDDVWVQNATFRTKLFMVLKLGKLQQLYEKHFDRFGR
jgi:hypothetical protein